MRDDRAGEIGRSCPALKGLVMHEPPVTFWMRRVGVGLCPGRCPSVGVWGRRGSGLDTGDGCLGWTRCVLAYAHVIDGGLGIVVYYDAGLFSVAS